MDHDYPMSRQAVGVLVVGLVVMVAIGIALFGGFVPGIHPNLTAPAVVTVQGHQYYTEPTPLHIPLFTNSSGPWNVTFHNVTFELWVTNWYSATGGIVHGHGTELNGTTDSFVLGGPIPNGTRVSLYLSPDLEWGASWVGGVAGGFSAQLLVKV
jgi:hypothetical protein